MVTIFHEKKDSHRFCFYAKRKILIVYISACYPQTDPDWWSVLAVTLAHKQAIRDRGTRVIIVICGDIGPREHLPSELKAYLDLDLYLYWDERDFWPKLRYAIEHSDFPCRR